MKKHAAIILSLLLLAGCANSRKPNLTQQTDDISGVPAETVKAPVNTYMNPAYAAYDAFMEHFDREEYSLPSNYQSMYFDTDVLVIQISDEDHSQYDFLSEYDDFVRIKTVEYTQAELEAIHDITLNILYDEHDIDIVSMGIDHKYNAISIKIFDRYTDEEKAEIASYVEDYPVIIKYVNSYHIIF